MLFHNIYFIHIFLAFYIIRQANVANLSYSEVVESRKTYLLKQVTFCSVYVKVQLFLDIIEQCWLLFD